VDLFYSNKKSLIILLYFKSFLIGIKPF